MTVIKRRDRDSFAKNAGPEAIALRLKQAKVAAAEAAREVEWLTALLTERTTQMAAGTWPDRRDIETTPEGSA